MFEFVFVTECEVAHLDFFRGLCSFFFKLNLYVVL
jgi:hypothetical protein